MTGGIRHAPSHTNVCKVLIFQLTFCAFYDYAGKADLSKGYWNPKEKIGGNHAFSIAVRRMFVLTIW